MIHPACRLGGLCVVLLALSAPASSQAPAKRALTHADYAAWRSIQQPTFSADGSMVAYSLTPQEGDGEFVLRQVASGKEFRHPIGSRPVTVRAAAAPAAKAAPDVRATRFSPDGKHVLFAIFPPKDARPKGPAEPGRTDLGIMDTTTGTVKRIELVQRFAVPKSGGVVAYLRGVAPAAPAKGARPEPAVPETPTTPPNGLALHDLADGKERNFSDVTEFGLSKDGRWLVWAVNGRKDGNGVFASRTATGSPVVPVMCGAGKFSRLTWDEKQTQLVFFRTPIAAPGSPAPVPRIVHWRLSAPASPVTALSVPITGFGGVTLAAALVSAPVGVELKPAGKADIRPGNVLREQGGLAFSADGTRVFFGVAVPPPVPKPATPGEEKANVELWHFKDDFVQSMQKSQYARSQGRTFRAVFDLADRSCRQLADETLAEVTPAPAGDGMLGLDDRAYRHLVGGELASTMSDVYLVDSRTGTRKKLKAKAAFPPSFSAGGKYVLSFDGKDWHSISVIEGKSVNLTAKLGVSFANELNDMPMTPPAYGVAGWTAGDASVLLYDRFDIWRVAPDGSGAKNLTATGRKDAIQFRLVQLDREAKTYDLDKPILVRAESEKTRDTGFYRLDVAAKKFDRLLMGARNYGPPIKAERDGRLLLTACTFYEFPDLFVADADFRELKRVSDANPQKANFVWGKSRLVKYKDADGVALQGVLVAPEDFDPNKKYPMIVYIYERLSQNLHRFVDPQPGTSINPSFYASNGYLVLMPDIRYTVGYPGQSAMKCVLPAVQAVVDLGCVDEKAIGLQGHSWGGYQTAFMVTQTTRFKAASAGAPVVNMTSAYGGIRWGTGLPRQFQYEKTQSRIGGTLWQYPTRFLENSPLFAADRVETPLLMLHNDQDEAVPYQQGLEFYLALRRLGKEAYLFNYPGEAHGLRRRVNQKDYTVRMQQFFDHHLKGAAKPEWMEKGQPYTPPVGATRGTRTR